MKYYRIIDTDRVKQYICVFGTYSVSYYFHRTKNGYFTISMDYSNAILKTDIPGVQELTSEEFINGVNALMSAGVDIVQKRLSRLVKEANKEGGDK